MDSFIKDNFLLETDFAQDIYENFAKSLPIIDFHCHLPVEDIAKDRQFSNLTEVWLQGDHYKWRAMRSLGIPEEFITGTRSDEEKFIKYAETIPYALRNPLYHWSHLELERYFGITEILNKNSARRIYNKCNDLLSTPAYSARNLLKKMKVEVVCTSDDPLDDLRYHKQIASDDFEIRVLPTFRPDGLLNIEKGQFKAYITKLKEVSGVEIQDFKSLLIATKQRIDYFDEVGCRLSDHGLDYACSDDFSIAELDEIIAKKLNGEDINAEETSIYKSGLMHYLGKYYAEKNWVMQLHLGPIRNANSRLKDELGADAGVDSIGDFNQAVPLAKYLDGLEKKNLLPKTILYNVNPADNEVMATMAGNFMSDTPKGKIQHGSAWWFLDQKDGIEKQLNAISNMGLLSCFVGMLTDSRSLLSYPRHEYFRRVLCNLFGNDVSRNELPEDREWIGKIVADICYSNAKEYFNFPER
ncbi:MAG: glucuronate isomerase [Flavobacteriaceae bacterium]|nr:glucuronate isomerase [Flavobacteriaceae bacterium]